MACSTAPVRARNSSERAFCSFFFQYLRFARMLAPSSSGGDGGIPKNPSKSRGVGVSVYSVVSIHSMAVAVGMSEHHHIIEGRGGRGDLLVGHRAVALHV